MASIPLALLSVILVITGCSIQVKSQPDATIPRSTLVIAAESTTNALGRNFNPFLATNRRMGSYYIYEPLAILNGLNGDLTPWLASSWKQPTPSSIDFTVRSGVSWSDGEPLTADDVAFTLNLLKKYPALDSLGAWLHLKSVRADGDHVIMDLKGDDSPALKVIAQTVIVPQHIWSKQAHPDTWENPNPVGTGPFTLDNFALRQYTMNRNPNYWQADKIKVKQVLMTTTASQLDIVTKGYDWAYAFISDVDHVWLGASDHNRYWFPPAGNVSFIPNLAKKPFEDVNVRKGISLALNRDKIADTASEGTMAASGQTGLVLPNQKDQLNPDIPDQGKITRNREDSLAAFKKAGYTLRGDRLVDSSGKQLEFTLEVPNGYSDWLRSAQEVIRQLGNVGVKVNLLQPQPAAQQLDLNNGNFEAAIASTGNSDIYTAFNGSIGTDFYRPVGKSTTGNYERFRSERAGRLLEQYKSTTNTTKQRKISYELQQIFYDDLPVINLYYAGLWGLYNDSKFTGWPTADDPYAAPQNYTASALLIFTHLEPVEGDN